jgi:CRISPR/Cas system-associated endonuclease/helicase Cas3
MNEMIFHAITAIERQLAELRELIVTTTKDLEHIESMKKVDEILFQTCSDLMDVNESQIKSRTRKRAVVDARAICIAFTYFAENHKTLKCIGESFGLDHATVLHSVKKCCNLYTRDAQFKYLVNDFILVFENNGYNCTTTKQRLTDGHQYFKIKGTITRGKNLEPGESIEPTNKIERMSFHCAIS